jgi:hypothetical protein
VGGFIGCLVDLADAAIDRLDAVTDKVELSRIVYAEGSRFTIRPRSAVSFGCAMILSPFLAGLVTYPWKRGGQLAIVASTR